MTKLCIVFDRLRSEEKMLKSEAESLGCQISMLDAKTAHLDTDTELDEFASGDVTLERCISYFRGLHMTAALESMNMPVINSYDVASICGNKMLMTLRLKRAKVKTPKTYFAFSSDTIKDVFERAKYPLVIKPVIGSWGRGVVPIYDEDTLMAILEARTVTDGPFDRVFYLQEIITSSRHLKGEKRRDIRVITVGGEPISAMYRDAAGGFRANVAVGGEPKPCEITPQMAELAIAASDAVGGGILGVDMMEKSNDNQDGDELIVHEVNNTVEFKGISKVSQKNIPKAMVQYAINVAKR